MVSTPETTVGVVGAAVTGIASLPQAFEDHPYGAAIVVVLVILICVCGVAQTWIKYR